MSSKTSPEIFSELSELIAELEITSSGVIKTMRDIDTSSLDSRSQETTRKITDRLAYINSLVRPMEEYSKELFAKSITDGLTNLKNRGYFEEVIKNEIENIEEASCIMVDIDHFGRYNNTYGHQQGDKALQTTAGIIETSVPTEFIARYGGEEFSIMLAGYSRLNGNTGKAAEKIRKNIENAVITPFAVEVMGVEKVIHYLGDGPLLREICDKVKDFLSDSINLAGDYESRLKSQFILNAFEDKLKDPGIDRQSFSRRLRKVRMYLHGMQKVTVSVGVAVRKPGESVESMIYHADRALYQAKEQGRNMVHVH
jgi:diguanylate cyclase (GGDEF)-like protein